MEVEILMEKYGCQTVVKHNIIHIYYYVLFDNPILLHKILRQYCKTVVKQ